ncbi:MAG: Crp/Fnr family transcriptional regulator [Acaryochloris sp. RU_4_1]|nr:Crp/Fnr family transcriptional regulator [Acaryochloris sp. RU_4_1]NJR56050.1 Crp/Fnr family transcriptional regulator [Acaryochloris sp. CRU_2_0]
MSQSQISASPSSIHWPQLLEEVYRGRQTYEFKRSFDIPLSPHDIWIVCRGIVQLSTFTREGDEAILGMVYPDIPFGLPLTCLEPYVTTALTDVVLLRLSQAELERSPMLAQGIMLQLNRRLQQAEELLALTHQHPMSLRCQQLLLLLAKEIGEQTPDGIRLRIRLTHQQIANLLGSSRVSITRLFGLLRKQGWLSIDTSHHIVIRDSAVMELSQATVR